MCRKMHLRDRCIQNGRYCVVRKHKLESNLKEIKGDLKKQKTCKDLATYGNRGMIEPAKRPSMPQLPVNNGESRLMLEALNGFLIFITKKMTIKFISSTVHDHLGLKQERMIGRSVLEYIHTSDQHEISRQFADDKGDHSQSNGRPVGLCEEPQRVFYVRMKFTLTKPGTKTKHSGFMLVQWTGKMKRHVSTKTGQCVADGLLCICRPMQTAPLVEIRMDGNMFMSRHDMGMTFTFCDTRIITLIGYEPDEVLGKTAYHFHNPIDAPKVSICHQNLIAKGSSISKYYRFMGKNENWVWLQTRATIIYNTANKPQYIVCMNYVISEEEGERYLMLEEHQHANQERENTVLMLPDNTHHTVLLPDSPVLAPGPRIIELEEDHLVATARFPPALTPTQPSVSQTQPRLDPAQPTLSTQHLKQIPLLEESPCFPVPCPVDEAMVGSEDMDYQPMGASPCMELPSVVCISPDLDPMLCSTVFGPTLPVTPQGLEEDDSLDLTAQADSPADTSTSTLSNSASPSSGLSSEDPSAMNYPSHYMGRGGYQGMALTPTSSYTLESDQGYDSSSPYQNNYSPAGMVSPSCSDPPGYSNMDYDNSVPNMVSQVCPTGAGYASGGGSQNSVACTNHSQHEEADNYLDVILNSLSGRDTERMDFDTVCSTLTSLVTQSKTQTQSHPSVSHNLVSHPPVSNISPAVANYPVSASQPFPATKSTHKPAITSSASFLRKVLTMPEKDLPTNLSNSMSLKIDSSSKICPKQNIQCANTCQLNSKKVCEAHSVLMLGDENGRLQASIGHDQPRSACSLQTNSESDVLEYSGVFSGVPDDISDFAMQYLDDVMDMQAQAVIGQLQKNDGSYMETSSDQTLARDLLHSLETECGDSQGARMGFKSDVSGCHPGHLCRAGQGLSGMPNKMLSHPMGLSPFARVQEVRGQCMKAGDYPAPRYHGQSSPPGGKSGEDHVYHQCSPCTSQQSLRSPYPGSDVNCNSTFTNTASQTQSSEYCLSELEKHIRNKRAEACRIQTDTSRGGSMSYLQQLLTGELTKDSYIQMENDRLKQNPYLAN
ncbi:protein similar-like isoform X2 [Dreissena polymorpha]|nr:protein similar-like isoform X2 [Dreissena polymorpha]